MEAPTCKLPIFYSEKKSLMRALISKTLVVT